MKHSALAPKRLLATDSITVKLPIRFQNRALRTRKIRQIEFFRKVSSKSCATRSPEIARCLRF